MKTDETSQAVQAAIISEIRQGHDQSLEQVLYCAYDYTDCISANRCQGCNLSNYGRDCNNNEIINI